MRRPSPLTLISLGTLVLMALAAPFLVLGADQALRTMFNAPIRWIPEKFDSLRTFHEFTSQFDVHEMILLSWPDATVDDPRLDLVAEEIMRRQQQRTEDGLPELFVGVPNGYRMLQQLTSEPQSLSRTEAIERLKSVLVGPDEKTSTLAIELTPEGALDRRIAHEIALASAEKIVGLPRDQYLLAGPATDGLSIDQMSIESVQTLAIPSSVLAFLLCCVCLRSIWFTIPIVIVAAVGQGLVLALVFWLGLQMNAILIVLPPLVFVLAISAGIHLVNYYYSELSDGNFVTPAVDAIRKGWFPTVLAAVTTAIGLASLMVSEVAPVRHFGIVGAIGLLVTCALLLLVLPGAMEHWPGRKQAADKAGFPWWSPLAGSDDNWIWNQSAQLIRRFHRWIVVTAFVLLAFTSIGLTRVSSTLNVFSMISETTKAVQDQRWFETNVAPSVPVEIIVRFPDLAGDPRMLDKVRVIEKLQNEVLAVDHVQGVISPYTFLPPIPDGGDVRSVLRRTVYRRQVEKQLPMLVEAGYVRQVEGAQLWRISGRVEQDPDIDYGTFLVELEEQIAPAVSAESDESFPISATYTGVTSVVYDVQRALLKDLFYSFVTAIALVGIVMVVVLRSVVAGTLAMVPNIFPTVLVFGTMGWLNWAVDIGSMMTASVALGIAVDGTFHFLGSFQHALGKGADRFEAIRITYGHCGRALAQTTFVCAAGLLVYNASDFIPARSFSWMLLVLLVIAAVGDLVVLPGLLAGPPGRWFRSERQSKIATDTRDVTTE
ncbi:efflux RND transporter permease subunit [Bremerella cremea]|uniref:efflux RND transporter permease subunit n=1 Tax=Bremerella cremea TaxID=1031537 RepID=UPI0031EC77C4